MIELKHICKTFDSGGGEVEALKDEPARHR